MAATKKSEALPTAAVEDYAKAIYSLTGWGEETASTNDLAERLGVKAGSVSAMIKKLDEAGLVERVPYHGVRLTADGTRVAMTVPANSPTLRIRASERTARPSPPRSTTPAPTPAPCTPGPRKSRSLK